MSPVSTTFDQGDENSDLFKWWKVTTTSTSAAFSGIQVIQSRWIPEGQVFLASEDGQRVIYCGMAEPLRPPTRWERIVRWMRRFLTEHY